MQQTRLAYADTIGDERLGGQILSLGPLLQWLDNFGGDVAQNAVAKSTVMAAVEHVEVINPISHGDVVRFEGELINIGRSSLTLQVTGYRHDISTRKFLHSLDAVMTAVAVDENMRPCRELPELLAPGREEYIAKLKTIAQHRKALLMGFQAVEQEVEKLSYISQDMIVSSPDEHSTTVSVSDTVVALGTSFLPRHLNRVGTVFGGEMLAWMDKAALYCGKIFTANSNMVTVSASRISFKLPATMDDIASMVARVCGVRGRFVDVEVQVFLRKFASQERQKSHTGYFTVANLDASNQAKPVERGLSASEENQLDMRELLKAQQRQQLRKKELELLHLDPLALSPIAGSHL